MNANDVIDCFNGNVYNTSEMIEKLGWNGLNIDHEYLWTSDITQFEFGKCHALKYLGTLGVNGQTFT